MSNTLIIKRKNFFDCDWLKKLLFSATVEPRFNEPLFNKVLDITNDILRPGQNYSKIYGIEPRYNEFFDITNVIQKPKRKIYLSLYN